LLAKAVSYAVAVIGDGMVRRTLDQLDAQTDTTTLDLAGRSGLRGLIQNS
jgi:hypothetical protein